MLKLSHRNIPIAIIGGGIHGISIASRITRDVPQAARHLAILDRHPQPLMAWQRKTQGQGMAFLRSPAVHHISSDPLGIVEYARTQNRTTELAPPYSQPSVDLFLDFCLHEIEAQDLQQSYHQFDLVELQWEKGSGRFPFRMISQKNEGFRAACVILAIGADDCFYMPPELALFKRRFPESILHSCEFELRRANTEFSLSKIVIVGGGLTAATLARNLTDLGAQVVLITRKPLKSQQFDFEPSWLGPKAVREFGNEPDWEKRREIIQQVRGAGSITPEIYEALTKSVADGNLCLYTEAKILQIERDRQPWITTTEGPIDDVDLVLLATGYRFEMFRYRFLSNLTKQYKIPTLCGLPQLDESLQLLPVENLFASGVAAQLQIGPAAGNIAGAALAYDCMREKVLRAIPTSYHHQRLPYSVW